MINDNKSGYSKSHESVTQNGSAIKKYQQIIIGKTSWKTFLYYEYCTWLSIIPGTVGLLLRKIFWPRLFGSCGKGVLFSSNVIVRHPHRIHLGNNVIISERCILDARTETSEKVITIGDNVILSNDVALTCKGGSLEIGNDVGIGTQTVIQSTYNCPILIGKDTMLGPRCYLVAGGSYNTSRTDIPMRQQGVRPEKGIIINNDVWIGANVTILSGIHIGHGSIIGAGSVVTKNIEKLNIVAGNPAKLLKVRSDCNNDRN